MAIMAIVFVDRFRVGQVMLRVSLSAIAPGAMADRRKAIRRRPVWPDSDINISKISLRDFHAHTRDNPFSKQYMWGAAANLSAANRARSGDVFFDAVAEGGR